MQAEADASWGLDCGATRRVFGIANTASLARELEPVRDPKRLEAGDVFIEGARGGRFGHAVLVLDVAESASGERVFSIAQSYMPAQDIHVLVNPGEPRLSPWYRATADGSLVTPEWSFPPGLQALPNRVSLAVTSRQTGRRDTEASNAVRAHAPCVAYSSERSGSRRQ